MNRLSRNQMKNVLGGSEPIARCSARCNCKNGGYYTASVSCKTCHAIDDDGAYCDDVGGSDDICSDVSPRCIV